MFKLFAGRQAVFTVHFSLVLIVIGALVTAFSAQKGLLYVRVGESSETFKLNDGTSVQLPFTVELSDFEVIYHPGTDAAADFRSAVRFEKDGRTLHEGEIRMNRIMSCKGYRFYQTDYDSDEGGVSFTVGYDPVGTAIVYSGYVLLLLGLLLFFFTDRRFRKLFDGAMKCSSTFAVALCFGAAVLSAAPASGKASPKVLPKEAAAEFGNLYVLYHGRICPLQTLASDFTSKLYGTSGVKGMTDEQVLTGWMFYGSSWRNAPMHSRKKAVDAMDKDAAVTALYSGELLKIYPLRDTTGRLGWYSQSDRLPDGVDDGEWLFVRKSMDYIFERVINRDYATLHESLEKLRRFQEGKMGSETPKPFRIKAERIYNSLPPLFPFAGTFLLVGLLSLAVSMSGMVKSSVVSAESSLTAARNPDETESLRIFKVITIIAAVAFFLGLTLVLGLLWVAGGHIPFSNGAETMLSIAWTAALVALIGFRKFPLSIPFGVIVASLATLVAAMGNANPAVTQLMPVLSSPLLSIHVSLMMLSYTALAVIMVNGLCGFCISLRSDSASKAATARMALMSEALMFPTLFLLGSGIIAGSVWANVSWGCYWNWDPKETWALITFLIASAGVHRARLPFLRSPKSYHIYTLVLSASVLFTYFGVNYLLGGMHSYA